MKSKTGIGIDLGTTTSCASVFKNGKPEMILDVYGNYSIPSLINFNPKKLSIGNFAKNKISYQGDMINNVKRYIGLSFDEFIQLNDKFNYNIIKDPKRNAPLIPITHKEKKHQLTPEQISSFILLYIKKQAERQLKEVITDAVITVPANFNQNQIKATRDAAKLANLNVIRIIKEPTAAAIAYYYNQNINNEQKIVVFDLGGGTLDISILSLNKGYLEVIYTNGDNHLGGEDFDERLVNFCIEQIQDLNNIDLNGEQKEKIKARKRLKIACEKAKIDLSNMLETKIDIENLYNEEDINISILRKDFESYSDDLFKKTEKVLKQTFSESKINKNEIGNVILAGGSSNIPKIKEIVSRFFENKFDFSKNENRNIFSKDELIAKGAAIQAAIVNKMENNIKFFLLDKYPKTIGIASSKGEMITIFPKNSRIPIQKKKKINIKSKQMINIYEGDNKYAKDNVKLESIELDFSNIPVKNEIINAEITFFLDIDSVLHVSVIDENLGIKFEKKIECNNLSEVQIEYFKEKNASLLNNEKNEKLIQLKQDINNLEIELANTYDNLKKINILNKEISLCEQHLNQIDKSSFEISEEDYITVFKIFLNTYSNLLENNSPKDENEIHSHIQKISFYVNKIDIKNINELISILKIIKNDMIFKHIVISLLEKCYVKSIYFYGKGRADEAKNGFIQIKNISKQNQLDKTLGLYPKLKVNHNNIINKSNIYIRRILANELLKYGDDIQKNNKNEMINYIMVIEKYNEAYKIILSEGRKDLEYEAKCLSKILYISYRKMCTNDKKANLLKNKNIMIEIERILHYLDTNLIQNEEWYKNFLLIEEEINNNDESIKKIKNNFKNLKASDFLEFILNNYPFEGSEKYKNIKSDFLKHPKDIIQELNSKYNTIKIKKKDLNFFMISKLLSNILTNLNSKNGLNNI